MSTMTAREALEKAALICEERADDDCAFAIRALAASLPSDAPVSETPRGDMANALLEDAAVCDIRLTKWLTLHMEREGEWQLLENDGCLVRWLNGHENDFINSALLAQRRHDMAALRSNGGFTESEDRFLVVHPDEQREVREALMGPTEKNGEGPTPRTDQVHYGCALYERDVERYRDMAQHARQLERELEALKGKIAIRAANCILNSDMPCEALTAAQSASGAFTAYIAELEKRAEDQMEWEKNPKCESRGIGAAMQVIVNDLRALDGRNK